MDDIVIRELIGFDEIATIYPLYSQTGSLPEPLFRERLAVMIAQGNYRCVAAFMGDRVVGTFGFWVGMQLWAGKWAEADHVVVDENTRSAGIGGRLMSWFETEAVRIGCDLIRISMLLGKDRTHSFYSRNGFADDGLILVKPLSAWAEAEFPEYTAHKRKMLGG